MENKIQFSGNTGTFFIHNPKVQSSLYLPVANEEGIKSSVTQNFGGDCKRDQNTFLLEPVSVENLHNNRSTRNIWCKINQTENYSLTGVSAQAEYEKFIGVEDEVTLQAGFMWQTVNRISRQHSITSSISIFAPLGYPVEIMHIEIGNQSKETMTTQIVAAIPIYGRSADNLRDHRHVTSLLHRVETTKWGVTCKPVLSFDERGHQKNKNIYFAFGLEEDGCCPEFFFPTVEDFIGESGSFLAPEALKKNITGVPAGTKVSGKEAMGGISFSEITLAPGESRSYTVILGVSEDTKLLSEVIEKFRTKQQVIESFESAKKYWNDLVNVSFESNDSREDNYLKWICFQPILRRIYGCSFLPYHDYGKGGRGWRDLWQDCLSLLIMDPTQVRSMIQNSFAGVRIDGSNATIIGNGIGEFVADRNNIARVWMDHAYWPFVTTKFYMDQTGDIEILDEKVTYFKDPQTNRGMERDEKWNSAYGMRQKTEANQVYEGSVLEHILLQNLCAFYEAGEHNSMRLRGADWNDAMDMAEERGESVAFTCAYIGNLRDIADYLEIYEKKTGKKSIKIAKEMEILFSQNRDIYSLVEAKQEVLSGYLLSCRHSISGEQVEVTLAQLRSDLKEKADWYAQYIREQEWVLDEQGRGWFNGYYDNNGRRVEGIVNGKARMMLTGQVFAIMGGVADDAQVQSICESADAYLYKREVGGYRLNTDFEEEKYDLGRMFGFAYGEKENGAVFSHMSVMYANALYKRGFVKEGYKVLEALLQQSMNSEISGMYPGIPEYFDAQGRGKYSYLTGAASWYMLTLITEVYGFRGDKGDLCIAPKLRREQFDEEGKIAAVLPFREQKFQITYQNPGKKDYGCYNICEVVLDGKIIDISKGQSVKIPFATLEGTTEHTLNILLG